MRTKPQPDLDFLQGSWSIVSLEVDGHSVSQDMVSDGRIEVKGSRFRSLDMGAVYEGEIELDPAASPKSFDLVFTKGPEKGNRNLGIYEIEDDGWRMCLATRGDARPREFATKSHTGHALQRLRRGAPAARRRKASKSCAPAPSKSPTELEGEWKLESGYMNGKPMDSVMIQWGVRTFEGNATLLKFGPQTYVDALFSLDGSQTPPAIDYSHRKGMYAGKTQLGIYQCDGAILSLSTAPPGQPRPKDFAESGSNTVSRFRKK